MQRWGGLAGWPGCWLLVALCWPAGVGAQDHFTDDVAMESFDEEPPREPRVTLSVSPLHLLVPMVELQAELRIVDHFGVAVLGGVGRVSATTANDETLHFSAWEVGGQFVWYPTEAFAGLQLGAEGLLMHVSLDDKIGNERVSGLGAGFSAGPFLGYKWISEVGFSVFIQGGFALLLIKAEATNGLGQTATRSENEILMLLNINLGWSF